MFPREADDFETAPLNTENKQHQTFGVQSFVGRARGRSIRLGWSDAVIGVLLLLVVGLSVALLRCGGKETLENVETAVTHHHDNADLLAAFLVIGDWGRRGEFNQSKVSKAMSAKADQLHPQFIISTGDNFYPHGLNSTSDKEFDYSFRQVYNWTGLQVPWYSVLGNHDYGDGADDYAECLGMDGGCPRSPLYQLDIQLMQRDRRWHCSRLYSLNLADGEADLFFMDTSPFITEYHSQPWAKLDGGIAQQSWESQLRELEGMLARSAATWKMLVAHHPVRSNGEHGDTQELRTHLQPLLEKYGVRVAFHGHDHDLEHIHVDGEAVHYMVSGAGSKTREMEGDKDALFQYASSGYMAVTLKREEMAVEFMGMHETKPLYSARIPRLPQ